MGNCSLVTASQANETHHSEQYGELLELLVIPFVKLGDRHLCWELTSLTMLRGLIAGSVVKTK